MVYVPLNGCASDVLTSKMCDKYSFRVYPAGRQTSDPAVGYEVEELRHQVGASSIPTTRSANRTWRPAGGARRTTAREYVAKIAVPLGEANVTPYVSKVPTDGSITGAARHETGSDLARVMSVIQQFGHQPEGGDRDRRWARSRSRGVYPDALNGAIITGTRPSDGVPGNARRRRSTWRPGRRWPRRTPTSLGPLGGVEHVTPGNNNGYNAYMSMKALVLAMRKANFTRQGRHRQADRGVRNAERAAGRPTASRAAR